MLLLAAPLLAPGIARRLRARALLFVGAAGFVILAAQGFAIGPQGWAVDSLARVFGPLATGQYGMGWGATLAATSFAMLFALGLAESGYFNGDAFIASSVVAIALSVAIFTFFPVVTILASAFEDGNGAISATAFFNRLFTAKIWTLACLSGGGRCGVAWNTLLLALLCAAGCTALGLAFALIVTRTSFRYKRMLRALSVLPIITPPFVIGLGLILMFGRAGIVNHWLEWAFGIEPSRWIYGLPGLALAQIFSFTPIAFLVLIGVVEGVSPSIEEAAQTLRANRWRTFVDVSLPLMRPGLANAFLISFIESIADFGNPDRARRQLRRAGDRGLLFGRRRAARPGARRDARYLAAAVRAGRFFRAASRARTQGLHGVGRQRRCRSADAASGRRAPRLLCGGAALGGADGGDLCDGDARRLRRAMGPQLHADLEALCEGVLDRMGQRTGILWSGTAWNSFWTTVELSAIAAPITAVLGILTAYILTRHRFAGRAAFEFGTMLSFAIPGTVIGVSYILAFNVPPIEITGTALVLIVCNVFRNMPVGVRAGIASMAQIDRSLDEASTTLGARGGNDVEARAAAAAQAGDRRGARVQLRARR